MSFTVAIVGRPNVGKSTLFNRLVGRKLALVDDTAGVTRDRRLADASIGDLHFQVVDTAGFDEAGPQTLAGRMQAQTEAAIAQADVILFLVDALAGIVPDDHAFATLLRKSGKPVIAVANKAERDRDGAGTYEAYQLGFGEPVPISAEHGQGTADLYEALVEASGAMAVEPEETEADFPQDTEDDPYETDPDRPLKIAIVGRPNVGKSTLINRMVGDERLLTGPEAGITRDSIAVDWQWEGRTIRLFDTAGMRRKARVREKLEKLSVSDGLRAVRFAEVVIVVFDATAPFEKQDLQIADLVIREGRAPVIALNKWDLITDRAGTMEELREKADRLLPQIKGLKLVPISGKDGFGLDRLMTAVIQVHDAWNRRVPTARLNRWLEIVQTRHPPPAVAGRRIRFKYATQAKTRPPTFVVACSRPEALPTSYTRYMMNSLREEFDLDATPLRLHLRKGANPYAGRRRNT